MNDKCFEKSIVSLRSLYSTIKALIYRTELSRFSIDDKKFVYVSRHNL